METALDPKQASRTARLATSLFFLGCFPLAMFDQFYVPQKVFVAQNPVTTAENLLSNETIFRLSIVTHLAGLLLFVFVALQFYRICRPLDKHLSLLMFLPIVAMFPITFVFEGLNFMALLVLKDESRPGFELAQRQEAAYYLMRILRITTGAGLGKLPFGLFMIPFGMIVYRSGIAPKIIGILLIIGGLGYVADCSIAILLQRPTYIAVRSVLMYTTVAYFLAFVWLLVKGVRSPSPA